MNYETIIVKKKGRVAIFTLNRPEQENRLNFTMVNEMNHALEALVRDDEVGALVINGAGGDFSCGWDASEEIMGRNAFEMLSFVEAACDMQRLMQDFPKPTVVAAHGRAVSSGAAIASMADITIMADDATMGFVSINFGLSCLVYIHHLRQIVGAKKALDLILTGRLLNAEQAERIGLVTRVVPKEKVLDSAMETATELASKSPLAVAFTKQANSAVRDMDITDATHYLNKHITLLACTEDGQEALKARVEGRTPQWKGC
jgi:enoyl-CoA hydratase/carnithine racemase